jgi:hypothetical protein
MQTNLNGDIGPEAKGISCNPSTEGNEDRQGWAWAEPSLSFLRYLLSRTSSVPRLLIVSPHLWHPRNPRLFLAGSTATRARVAKLEYNYENENQT